MLSLIHILDSLNKRIKFLNTVIEELGLEDIHTIHGRAEDYAKDAAYREKYDLCVSRAVANLATLSEYCLPYVKVGGMFIPYKSGEIDEEVKGSKKAVKVLGGEIEDVVKFELPGTDIDVYKRQIVYDIVNFQWLDPRIERYIGQLMFDPEMFDNFRPFFLYCIHHIYS